MNKQPKAPNEPKLSGEQLDRLLSSFFQNEPPSQLKQLPSAWDAIQNNESTPTASTQKSPSWYRRAFVAGSSLAAAWVLVLAADALLPSSNPSNGTTIMENVDNSESPLDQDATLNVSSQNDGQAIDDVNTSLEEIDMIDLSPQTNHHDKQLLDIK